jgi:hypothetical protein
MKGVGCRTWMVMCKALVSPLSAIAPDGHVCRSAAWRGTQMDGAKWRRPRCWAPLGARLPMRQAPRRALSRARGSRSGRLWLASRSWCSWQRWRCSGTAGLSCAAGAASYRAGETTAAGTAAGTTAVSILVGITMLHPARTLGGCSVASSRHRKPLTRAPPLYNAQKNWPWPLKYRRIQH